MSSLVLFVLIFGVDNRVVVAAAQAGLVVVVVVVCGCLSRFGGEKTHLSVVGGVVVGVVGFDLLG